MEFKRLSTKIQSGSCLSSTALYLYSTRCRKSAAPEFFLARRFLPCDTVNNENVLLRAVRQHIKRLIRSTVIPWHTGGDRE